MVVDTETLNCFKARINSHWQDNIVNEDTDTLYRFKEKIDGHC